MATIRSSPIGATADTILQQFAGLGVNVNGLIVPGRSIEGVLARHAQNLFVHTGDETFKVRLVGSATAVRYRGRYILLTTQHQLRDLDESQVSMMTDSGSHLITSSGRRGYNPSTETDAYDILEFDFTEPCEARPELKHHFFDLKRSPPNTENIKVLGILLAGYPSDDQAYEVHENNNLGLVRRQVVCVPDSQPSDEVLLTVRAVKPLERDPDGMSGGSTFVIQMEDGTPHAYFAGIIIRGGREYFHILKAGYVLAFLQGGIFSVSEGLGPVDT
jgi:hypothetical protein